MVVDGSCVLVLAEHSGEELEPITLQLIGKGRQLADSLGVPLSTLILGFGGDALAKRLLGTGVDRVLAADHSCLLHYKPDVYARAICEVVSNVKPLLMLLGYTYWGMELGPAIAARLGISLISNCIELELSKEGFAAVRPVHEGIFQAKVETAGSFPLIVSFLPGALNTEMIDPREAELFPAPARIDRYETAAKVLDVIQPGTGETDITKAEIIVAIGRGIRDPANLHIAKDLANVLGGVIACSRPLADLGWLTPEYSVGMSGKTVKPKVYMACGISGASQHVMGMRDSHVIIAINSDPAAPIFQVAHYGVVGDVLQILPAMTDKAVHKMWKK